MKNIKRKILFYLATIFFACLIFFTFMISYRTTQNTAYAADVTTTNFALIREDVNGGRSDATLTESTAKTGVVTGTQTQARTMLYLKNGVSLSDTVEIDVSFAGSSFEGLTDGSQQWTGGFSIGLVQPTTTITASMFNPLNQNGNGFVYYFYATDTEISQQRAYMFSSTFKNNKLGVTDVGDSLAYAYINGDSVWGGMTNCEKTIGSAFAQKHTLTIRFEPFYDKDSTQNIKVTLFAKNTASTDNSLSIIVPISDLVQDSSNTNPYYIGIGMENVHNGAGHRNVNATMKLKTVTAGEYGLVSQGANYPSSNSSHITYLQKTEQGNMTATLSGNTANTNDILYYNKGFNLNTPLYANFSHKLNTKELSSSTTSREIFDTIAKHGVTFYIAQAETSGTVKASDFKFQGPSVNQNGLWVNIYSDNDMVSQKDNEGNAFKNRVFINAKTFSQTYDHTNILWEDSYFPDGEDYESVPVDQRTPQAEQDALLDIGFAIYEGRRIGIEVGYVSGDTSKMYLYISADRYDNAGNFVRSSSLYREFNASAFKVNSSNTNPYYIGFSMGGTDGVNRGNESLTVYHVGEKTQVKGKYLRLNGAIESAFLLKDNFALNDSTAYIQFDEYFSDGKSYSISQQKVTDAPFSTKSGYTDCRVYYYPIYAKHVNSSIEVALVLNGGIRVPLFVGAGKYQSNFTLKEILTEYKATATSNTKLKNLLNSLEEYTLATEEFFESGKTKCTLTSAMNTALSDFNSGKLDQYDGNGMPNMDGLSVSGNVTLSLEDTLSVKFKVNIAEGYKLSDYVFKVNSATISVDTSDTTSGIKVIEVTGIRADKLGDMFIFEVYKKNASSPGVRLNYCPMSYCYNAIKKGKDKPAGTQDNSTARVCMALYNYYVSAKAYFSGVAYE